MIYQNAEVSKLFNESTIHVLDYEFEYDSGFPDPEKFPEFNNRVFRNNRRYILNSFLII